MKRLSQIRTALLEAVFPSDIYCIRCARIIDRSRYYGLCDKCSEGFNWAGANLCDKCGRVLGPEKRAGAGAPGTTRLEIAAAPDAEQPEGAAALDAEQPEITVTPGEEQPEDVTAPDAEQPEGAAPRLCGDCQQNQRYFDKGYTCAFYGVYAREVVSAMKMKDRPWIGRKLGEAMADRMDCEDEAIDLVIPVPVHRKREKKRGYNQAEVIARQFVETYNRKHSKAQSAKEWGNDREVFDKALFFDALSRSRETAPMKGLDVWERKANIEGAFKLKPGIATIVEGRAVALIDDIMTTGSTLSECARVLKEAGAARVIAITFAAGGDMNAHDEGSW